MTITIPLMTLMIHDIRLCWFSCDGRSGRDPTDELCSTRALVTPEPEPEWRLRPESESGHWGGQFYHHYSRSIYTACQSLHTSCVLTRKNLETVNHMNRRDGHRARQVGCPETWCLDKIWSRGKYV